MGPATLKEEIDRCTPEQQDRISALTDLFGMFKTDKHVSIEEMSAESDPGHERDSRTPFAG